MSGLTPRPGCWTPRTGSVGDAGQLVADHRRQRGHVSARQGAQDRHLELLDDLAALRPYRQPAWPLCWTSIDTVPAWRDVASMKVGPHLPHAHRPARRRRARDGRPEHGSEANSSVQQPGSPARDLASGDQHVDAEPSSVRPRGYHNTSLLLPDGRVLLAGSGRLDGSGWSTRPADIYSPPTSSRGRGRRSRTRRRRWRPAGRSRSTPGRRPDRQGEPRPDRRGDPQHQYGPALAGADVPAGPAANLQLAAPASANDAPPGVYNVFLVDDKGVPSKAAIVSIANAAPRGGAAPPQQPRPRRRAARSRRSRRVRARRLASGRVRLRVAGRIGTGQGGSRHVHVAVRRGTHRVAAARVALGRDCRFADHRAQPLAGRARPPAARLRALPGERRVRPGPPRAPREDQVAARHEHRATVGDGPRRA